MADLNTAMARGFATGLPGFGVVQRQDIDVLLKTQPDTFNLFLLALRELQQEKPGQNPPLWQDKMSFYQLAGIHGLPNQPWDNVRLKNTVRPGRGDGYCNHGTPTFPTWHRPYLAMYEQTIYKKMLDIAALYTDPNRKRVYQDAVKNFRLPFIDYHRPRNFDATFPGVVDPGRGATSYPYDFSLPQILTVPNVTVRDFPADNIRTISNPLASFRFPTGAMSESDWNVSGIAPNADMKLRTIRYPLNRFSRWNPITAANAAVNEIREDTVRLSLLFVENGAYGDYETYATNGTDAQDIDGKSASGSLESVHGNYHVYIGGGGHMGSVPTAAFDPIFWLHHCTIDRWFAVWQKAHPRSWFRDRNLAQSPLVPFRNPANQGSNPFWTSETSISTEAFGYTYPETANNPAPAAVQRLWEDQYGWARRLTPQANPNVRPKIGSFEPMDLKDLQVFQGIREFKPLTRQPAPLLPNVQNLVPQPTRRAMATPVPAADPNALKPSAVTAEPVPSFVANLVNKVKDQLVMMVHVDDGKGSHAQKSSSAPAVASSKSSHHIDEAHVSREWYVDDIIERLALNTSFTILYFIGAFENTDSIVGLMMAPTFAGLNHIFAAPVEACDNCQSQEASAQMARSTSPITSILLDYVQAGVLSSMRPEHVHPFLVKNLKWRVVTADGRVINPRDLSANHAFKNSVSCKVSPLPGQTGEVVYETYNDITAAIIGNAS